MRGRSVRDAVVIVAIFLLAVVSAPRLDLDYQPPLDEPELMASLSIRGTASDPVEMTNRYVVPIESAIRSLGDVTALQTRVHASGASIRVRLRPGSDVEVKAARLASELARVRSRLPEGSSLSVWPSGQRSDEPALVLAITGKRAAEQAEGIADLIRSARGVRSVQAFGSTRPVYEVRVLPSAPASVTPSSLASEIRDGLAPAALGRRVISAPSATRLADVRVRTGDRLVPLPSVASIEHRLEKPLTVARVNGQPAILMSVSRDDDVSLFTFDRAVRGKAGGRAEALWSDARELRTMLARTGAAMAIASVLLAAIGYLLAGAAGLSLGLYLPLCAAVFINVARLAGMRIDASVVILACIAFAGFAPLAAWGERRYLLIALFFAALVPIAVTFAGGSLQNLLRPSGWAFLTAAASAIAACFGVRQQAAAVQKRWQATALRKTLRQSAGVVLGAIAVTALLLSYFGTRLDPRVDTPEERSRLYLNLNLPAGTTLDQTVSALERLEKQLARTTEIERFWSFASAGSARTIIDVKPQWQGGPEALLFKTRLRLMLPFAPGMVRLSEGGGGGGSGSRELEERPFSDEKAFVYRFIVKGTDVEQMRRTVDAIGTRVARLQLRRGILVSDWPPEAPVLELAARPGTTPQDARAVAAELTARSTPPREWVLPTGSRVRVIAHGAPADERTIPQRVDLLSRTYAGRTLTERFDVRPSTIPGGVTRELGRFVLPVTANIPGYDPERPPRREAIDRIVATMPLPAGITIERPSLSRWTLSKPKMRAFVLASLLPALLLAAAAIVLSSTAGAAVVVGVALTGVSVTAPLLWLARADVDEATLFAIGCATCCSVAVAAGLLLRSGNRTSSTYRAVREGTVPAILAAVAGAVMLLVIAGGGQASRDGWRAPLLAAAAVLSISTTAGVVVAPAIGLLGRDLRRRRSPQARRMAQPVEWEQPGAPALTVRNVTKRYRSGFRALSRASFELTPGVIGLLGPNGAGKTTLLRILTGLLLPTRGQIRYRGVTINETNLPAYRRLIGFLPQEFNAYAGMTATGFLDYWALERGMEDPARRRSEVAKLLAEVGLENDARRRVRDFSGGMRQRIGIARALIGDPPLLIVDEPTTGLDLESRLRFRGLMTDLGRERIVILSTHIASDVEATATRILLLSRGRLLWDGAPETLIARAFGRVFEVVINDADARAVSRQYRLTYRVRVHNGVRIRGVVAEDAPLPGAAVEATLEEAYLAAMPGERSFHSGAFHFLYERG